MLCGRLGFMERHARFHKEIAGILYPDRKIVVLHGPFAGTKYYNGTFFGPSGPKWIGCYEEHLHAAIGEIAGGGVIVDVGSAEGYYAVGFARLMPDSMIYSFEVDPISRWQQRRLAGMNNITRNLLIEEWCSHADIARIAQKHNRISLIVDIEGEEMAFLDPDLCPALRRCNILVETHRSATLDYPEFSLTLQKRFQSSHEITVLKSRQVNPLAYPKASGLSDVQFAQASSEMRPHSLQDWLWMIPRCR